MRRGIFVLLIFMGIAAGLSADVDGIWSINEYPVTREASGMKLGARLNEGRLYLILEASTEGWLSIGMGSLRMDGAFMVMAYRDGEASVVSEQTGQGRSHRENSELRLSASAVREEEGKTILEFTLPAEGVLEESRLQLIIAYGTRDNLRTIHRRYATFTLVLD